MASRRYWQARVTYPDGGSLTFGVSAASLPAALLKAFRLAAEPGTASHLTVTRLYGRHHPLRAARPAPPAR
jgi:hypothetical protein